MADPTKKMINAYEMGLDCGRNGPNQENCDHTIFSEEVYTRAWDIGKEKDGDIPPQYFGEIGV